MTARPFSPVQAITSVMVLQEPSAFSTDKENKLQYVHQTSWGMTTRLIGAIIMVHGDDNGLVLPPMIAPTQVIVIPLPSTREGVLEKAEELKNRLSGFRVKLDATDNKPGWKFAEAEMRGIPVRVEIGPKGYRSESGCSCAP